MAFYQLKQIYLILKSIGPFKFVGNKDGRIPTKTPIFKQYK